MKKESIEKPTKLNIDVDQWRREIQTFAESTNQALDAIVADLSNRCSTSFDLVPTNEQHELTERPIAHFPAEPARTTDSHTDDRLAKLKLQLAERISKTN